MTAPDDVAARIRAKLLDAIEDLRAQAERNEIHALCYVAVAEDGSNVVTSMTNGGIRPVTLMGALNVLEHRLIEAISAGPSAEYAPGDGEPTN